MQDINAKIQDVLNRRKSKKQYLFVLFMLSIMVIAAVCFSLMTPAISVSGKLTCTKAEHIHSEGICYSRKLVCAENTQAHSHSADCYTTERKLKCELEEDEKHTHSEECYYEEQVLTCETPETEGHVHTEECYETEWTCEQDQHEHSGNCYVGGAEAADAEEQISEEVAVMPKKMQKTVAINDSNTPVTIEDGDGSVDLTPYINKLIMPDSNNPVQLGEQVEKTNNNEFEYVYRYAILGFEYNVREGILSADQRKVYYQLDSNIIPYNDTFAITDDLKESPDPNSATIGKYTLYPDGLIAMEFYYDNTDPSSATRAIRGAFSFRANVKKDGNENAYEPIIIGTKDGQIPFNPDLNVSKTCDDSNYNYETGELSYTITINSKTGSGTGDISVKDVLENLNSNSDTVEINTDTIKIKMIDSSDNSEIDMGGINITDANNFSINKLPAINPSQSYVITYTTTQKGNNLSRNIKTKNTVEVSNGTLTKTADKTFEKQIGCSLSKGAWYDAKNEKIDWTITVENESKYSLDGCTLSDDMLAQATAAGITITDDQDNPVDINSIGTYADGKFVFKDVSGSKYILKYSTEAKREEASRTVKNTVSLKKGENDIATSVTATATVPGISDSVDLKKSHEGDLSYNLTEDTYIHSWKIDINWVENYIGQTLSDSMGIEGSNGSNYHYMTPEQIHNLEIIGELDGHGGLDENGTWTWTDGKTKLEENVDYEIKYDIDSKGNITKFDITFCDSPIIEKLANRKISISYNTTGSMEGVKYGETRTFVNSSKFNNGKSSEADCIKTKIKPFIKYDGLAINGNDKTSHNVSQLEKIDDKRVLKWHITVNDNCYDPNEPITFTDTLPEDKGLTLLKDSVLYNNGKSNQVAAVQDGNIITFTVLAELHNGKGFTIDYSVSIPDDKLPQNENDKVDFENTIKDDSHFNINGSNYSSTQTQEITKKTPFHKYGCDYTTGNSTGGNITQVETKDLQRTKKGEFKLKWFIAVDDHAYSSKENIIFTDTLPEGKGLTLLKYSVLYNNGTSDQITAEQTGNIIKFTVPAALHNGRGFRMEYEVAVPEDQLPKIVGGTASFTNTVIDHNGDSAEQTQEVKKSEIFSKLDPDNTGWDKSNSTHNTTDLAKDEGRLILKWNLTINNNSYAPDKDIIFTDILPYGTTFRKGSVLYNGYEETEVKSESYVDSQDDRNKVKFTIPAGLHKGKGFTIDYELIIDDDKVPKVNDTSEDFKNEAIDHNDLSVEQTQTIVKKPALPITKTGIDPLSVEARKNIGLLKYTIDINPESEKLGLGYDEVWGFDSNYNWSLLEKKEKWPEEITIKDEFKLSEPDYVAYEIESVIVTNRDTGKQLIQNKNYKVETIDFDRGKNIIFTVPNAAHIEIEYGIKCHYTNAGYTNKVLMNQNYSADQVGTTIGTIWTGGYVVDNKTLDKGTWIDNEVLINVNGVDSGALTNRYVGAQYYLYDFDPNGYAESPPIIRKYDIDNITKLIGGAEFELYRYNGSDWEVMKNFDKDESEALEWGNDTSSTYKLETDQSGSFKGKVKLPFLDKKTLYMVKEVNPPEGYFKSPVSYYFTYNCDPSTVSPLPPGVDGSEIKKLSNNKYLEIPNRKLMPATGDTGVEPYIITGIALMIGSTALYFFIKGRKKRVKR